MPVDADKNKLQNCYLGFLKFFKFGKFWYFFNTFLFFKKSLQISNFQKPEYLYVPEEPPENVCTNF